jgi:hypothetical protein
MLRYLLEWFGVDYDQWRALVRISLKIDFRVAAGSSMFGQRRQSGYRVLLPLLIFYLVTGAFFAAMVLFNKDVFFTGTVFLTYSMFMIGALVLIEYHSVVISPDDYAILGYQPLSSRTYFAVKLTNALFYTALLTTALALFPIVAYFFTLGFNPALGLAAVLAVYLSTGATTLGMIILYAGVVRYVHPKRLNRALSYLQLTLSLLIYGGYAVLPEMIDKESLASMSLHKTFALFLHPATWFASYLDLAAGRWGAAELLPAIASLALLVLLVRQAAGKLSLDYSERLAALTSATEGRRTTSAPSTRRSIFFKRYEGRAVALLIRCQFKYDQKFRLGVLGILPLTIFYLFLGLRDGPFPDPFVNPELEFGRAGLLYLAIMLFPIMLKTTLVSSDSYQASWIFYATPADKERLVLSMKDFVMVYFVLPYLLFIGAIFTYFFKNAMHVFLHLIVLLVLAHILLQVAVLMSPDLPFSQPVRKGERSGRILIAVLIAPLITMLLLPALFAWAYPRPNVFAAMLAGLMAITLLLEKAVAVRVHRVSRRLQFQG